MVMPGSLDYLYYNGILDHIPYEAYEVVPGNNQAYMPMNGSQYLNAAKQGLMYDTYTGKDTFIKQPLNPEENEIKNFKDTITQTAHETTEKVSNSPSIFKGAIAGLILLGTTVCLLRGKKKPEPETVKSSGFFSKLNPKTWFKKK